MLGVSFLITKTLEIFLFQVSSHHKTKSLQENKDKICLFMKILICDSWELDQSSREITYIEYTMLTAQIFSVKLVSISCNDRW